MSKHKTTASPLTVRLPRHGETRRYLIDLVRDAAPALRGYKIAVRSTAEGERGLLFVSHRNTWCFQTTAQVAPPWQVTVCRQLSRNVDPVLTWIDEVTGQEHVAGQQVAFDPSQAMFEAHWGEKSKQPQSPG